MTTRSVQAGRDLGVIYQVYAPSFDPGGLRGITRRLDHLERLGVGTVWLSPIYPSPMVDGGYDVADHCDVDPRHGTLADLDALVAAAHARGLKVVLDYVPNHTSDRHPWFLASRRSRRDPRRDWYVWADPAPAGGPPNNWWNHFDGGPAWTWDAATRQYYLHLFSPHQPDLNWRNPAVEAAMADVLRFWLRRGVDGFRVDVPSHLLKDAGLRDEPPGPRFPEALHPVTRTDDLPEVHALLRRLRAVTDEFGGVLIGELWVPAERLMAYYGADDEFHLPYNFALLVTPWDAAAVRAAVDRYEALLPPGAWPTWVLGNHDRSRIASRVGAAQARVAMMALLTLRGTPTLYYGDELGMTDVAVPAALARDPQGAGGLLPGRDPARAPMRWDRAEERDPRSLLQLTRALIALRRDDTDLRDGPHRSIDAPEGVLAYTRGRAWTAVLNLTSSPRAHPVLPGATIALSTHMDRTGDPPGAVLDLRPDEGVLLRTG